jgi:hypothetical protein
VIVVLIEALHTAVVSLIRNTNTHYYPALRKILGIKGCTGINERILSSCRERST